MKKSTLLVSAGRDPEIFGGAVNIPVVRTSTVLFSTLAEAEAADRNALGRPNYGRYGTATTLALEETWCALEGGDRTFTLPSGVAAIVLSLTAFLNAGDHVLMVDSVYGPTRRLLEQELHRFGVEYSYYDPQIGAGIEALIQPNTRVVYVESPGSLTFEVQDIPAIAKAAHARDCVVIGDCTWGTPLFFQPFSHGIDVSLHSGTKYLGGHSDVVLGLVTCKQPHIKALERVWKNCGAFLAADDAYLALRGLRTLSVRLRQHQESALTVARWFQTQGAKAVLHPALPDCPGHEYWKRDFTGATGLFSVVLDRRYERDALAAMLDHLEHFGMGYSWGGYESLILAIAPAAIRTAVTWPHAETVLRLHIGLEDTDDLIADLAAGMKRLRGKTA